MKNRIHGFPHSIVIPKTRSKVKVLMRDGIPVNEVREVTIPQRVIGMRDARKINGVNKNG